LLKLPLAPLPGAANVTLTPGTGLPYWSVTVISSGLLKPWATVALWLAPAVAAMPLAAAAVFVSLNDVGVLTPVAVAVTLYVPELVLALIVSLA